MQRLEAWPSAEGGIRPSEASSNAVGRPGPESDVLPLLEPPDGPDCLGVLGEYRVVDVLGSGGMGVVLKAHEPLLDRFVAIKVLRPDKRTRELRERFLALWQSRQLPARTIPIYRSSRTVRAGAPFAARIVGRAERADHRELLSAGLQPRGDGKARRSAAVL
jgi:hypothetical protein